MDFEIKCYNIFSWGYIYFADGKRKELWADNLESLKRKVLAKDLPWDDEKVPEVKPTKIISTYIGLREPERGPVEFRLPWCKSNYKRY